MRTCTAILFSLLAFRVDAASPEMIWSDTGCWGAYSSSLETGADSLEAAERLETCLNAELAAADRALNAAYLETLDAVALPVPEDQQSYKDSLRNAQRNWIKFRDSDCERIALSARGIANFRYTSCLTYHTLKRTQELRAF